MYLWVNAGKKPVCIFRPSERSRNQKSSLLFLIIDQNGERKVPKLFLWCLRERRDETQPILLYVLKFWSEMREMIVVRNTDMMWNNNNSGESPSDGRINVSISFTTLDVQLLVATSDEGNNDIRRKEKESVHRRRRRKKKKTEQDGWREIETLWRRQRVCVCVCMRPISRSFRRCAYHGEEEHVPPWNTKTGTETLKTEKQKKKVAAIRLQQRLHLP